MRTFDATVHNRIANHPDVIHNLVDPRDGAVDFSELVIQDNRAFFMLLHNEAKTAAMVFEFSGPGIWQMHTMFDPLCRGRDAIREGKKLIHEVFTRHGADVVWGQTPIDNRAAQMFNRWIGARDYGLGTHSKVGAVRYFRNDKEEWLRDHWRGDDRAD